GRRRSGLPGAPAVSAYDRADRWVCRSVNLPLRGVASPRCATGCKVVAPTLAVVNKKWPNLASTGGDARLQDGHFRMTGGSHRRRGAERGCRLALPRGGRGARPPTSRPPYQQRSLCWLRARSGSSRQWRGGGGVGGG